MNEKNILNSVCYIRWKICKDYLEKTQMEQYESE